MQRDGQPHRWQAHIALITSFDRIQHFEHGNMHDRHGAACPSGTELLSEDALLAGRHRRVIQPARVDRNVIPVLDPVGRIEERPWPASQILDRMTGIGLKVRS